MKIDKEFIVKNLLTIFCVASILFFILPFGSVTVNLDSSFIDASTSTTLSGFDMLFGNGASFGAWIMLICPIILIAMNYIKQLDKYKSLLAVVLPIVSIIAEFCTLLFSGVTSEASAGGETASASAKVSPSIGFFLLIIAYIGTLIAGAVTFYGLKLSKEGIAEFGSKLKENGLNSLDSMKDLGGKISDAASNITDKVNSGSDSSETAETNTAAAKPQPKAKPKTNVSEANEVLELIANLSKLKESGILSEEEFNQKKKELLDQI